MTIARAHPYDPDELLDEAVAAYLEALETGRAPDPKEWLRQYPEFKKAINCSCCSSLSRAKRLRAISPWPSCWKIAPRTEVVRPSWSRDGCAYGADP